MFLRIPDVFDEFANLVGQDKLLVVRGNSCREENAFEWGEAFRRPNMGA